MSSGCSNAATKQLHLKLVARGYPAIPKNTIDAVVGLWCCDAHCTEEAVDGVFNFQPARDRIEEGFCERGLVLPDWERSSAYWGTLVGNVEAYAQGAH